MSEIRSALEELKGVSQEIFNCNKRLKELRGRKKKLEEVVIEYLDANDKNGLRLDNINFIASEKNTRAKKKKAEIEKDSVEILARSGVSNPHEVLEKIEEARRGSASSVPVLKMQAAKLFS